METVVTYAEKILKKAQKPLKCEELVKGYKPPKGGKTPHKSLASAIGEETLSIKRISPNRYWLKSRMNELEEMKNCEIKKIAYSLWEKANRPISDGKEFWLKAEELYTKNLLQTKG